MYFSVCIPTYNRKYILPRALQSLADQTFQDFEVLIIDDGSNDSTEGFVKTYKQSSKLDIKYFYKENGGKHTALNVGIKEARGKFFLILDSDDIFTNDCLEFFFEKCKNIENAKDICGIIARCGDITTRELIGKIFPQENFLTSYIDIHFGTGLSLFHTGYSDCLEAIKTTIIKQYTWPEIAYARFIPEDYVTDMIGMKFKLIGFNKIVELKEYLKDGITKNQEEYKKRNIDGYLLKYIWNIQNLLTREDTSILAKFRIGYQYFHGLELQKSVSNLNPKIPFPYNSIRHILPILNKIKWQVRKINS